MKDAIPAQDLATVMTRVGGTLRTEIGPQGGFEATLVKNGGDIVADKADISRIQTLNASITKERKEAQKEDAGKENGVLMLAMLQVGTRVNRQIDQFPDNFIEVFRPINSSMQALSKNVIALEAVETHNAAQNLSKNVILEVAKRIRVAVGKYLYYRATLARGETPRKINHFLREENAPAYFWSKLTTAIAVTQRGFDIRSLIFPADPTKGFYLTFREIVENTIPQSLGGLLEFADVMLTLFENDQAPIRAMINIGAEVNLADFDEANSFASKIASTPFFVPPSPEMVEPKTVFNFLVKNGTRGLAWASGTTLSPQDNLKFVGTLAKRIFYGLIPRPQLRGARLTECFPAFVFDPSLEASLFVQLKSWSDGEGRDLSFFRLGNRSEWNETTRPKLLGVLADVMDITTVHPVIRAFQAATDQTVFADAEVGENTTEQDLFVEVKNASIIVRALNEAEIIRLVGAHYQGRALQAGQRRATTDRGRPAGTTERSMLGIDAKEVVGELRRLHYTALAKRLEAWFRQFLTVEVQGIVASIFRARLEAFLATPVELTRQERLGFTDPDEFADEGDPADDEEQPDDGNAGAEAPVVNPDNE